MKFYQLPSLLLHSSFSSISQSISIKFALFYQNFTEIITNLLEQNVQTYRTIKNIQNYKEKNFVSDNIVYMQVKTFLTKLKGLIKKISRSSNTQIQSHTLTCHRLISQLIKDDDILTTMSSQKLRLLAYESILYLVQVLDYKKDQTKCSQSMNQKGKINSYLGQIHSNLNEIKELLKKCDKDGLSSGRKSYLPPTNETITTIDKHLNQYAYRLEAIFTQLQNYHHKSSQPPQSSSSTSLSYLKPTNPQDYKDCIIQQMQRVVQKKQKLISQLNNQKIRIQNQKLLSQNQYIKYQQLLKEKQDELVKELMEIKHRNKQLEVMVEDKGQKEIKRLQLQSTVVNIKILQGEKYDYNNNQSIISTNNKAIQPLTNQTINSLYQIPYRQSPMRKPNLNRVSSAKSFKRYFHNFQQKQSGFMNQKRERQFFDKNEDLYMLILCQAATIEEIL